VAGYYIYRTSPPGKNYIKLNSEPLTATQYTDATVEAGHTYIYYVTAVDSEKRESPASKVVSAMVPTP
jgi:fibronectin type 3 domain-containing protein